jgi:hypothetical protein
VTEPWLRVKLRSPGWSLLYRFVLWATFFFALTALTNLRTEGDIDNLMPDLEYLRKVILTAVGIVGGCVAAGLLFGKRTIAPPNPYSSSSAAYLAMQVACDLMLGTVSALGAMWGLGLRYLWINWTSILMLFDLVEPMLLCALWVFVVYLTLRATSRIFSLRPES